MRRLSPTRLAVTVVLLCWLGVLAYVWIWTRRDWGAGWALVGTVNITIAALGALGLIWVVSRLVGRLTRRS
jgi:hypothetical protein